MNQRLIGQGIDEAERALEQAEQKHGKTSLQICDDLDRLAELYHVDGLYAKAELLYKRSLDIREAEKSGDPAALATALHRLGIICRVQNKYDEAESYYKRALAQVEALKGEDSPEAAELLNYLSGVYNARGDWAEAEKLLRRSLEIYHNKFGTPNYYSGLCWLAIALVCWKQGQQGKATEGYEQSLQHTSKDVNERSEARALIELAQLYYTQGRHEEAEILLRHSVVIEEESLWPTHPLVADALHTRAELFRAQGRFAEAEKYFRRSIELRQRIPGCAHPELANTAMSLASMYMANAQYADAEPVLKLAMKTRVRAFGVEHPSVAACIECYAAMLKRTKRTALAGKLDSRAKDIRTHLVQRALSEKA